MLYKCVGCGKNKGADLISCPACHVAVCHSCAQKNAMLCPSCRGELFYNS